MEYCSIKCKIGLHGGVLHAHAFIKKKIINKNRLGMGSIIGERNVS